MADSSSYEVFTLVWVMYQLTKSNKYNKLITCMPTRGNEQMVEINYLWYTYVPMAVC